MFLWALPAFLVHASPLERGAVLQAGLKPVLQRGTFTSCSFTFSSRTCLPPVQSKTHFTHHHFCILHYTLSGACPGSRVVVGSKGL